MGEKCSVRSQMATKPFAQPTARWDADSHSTQVQTVSGGQTSNATFSILTVIKKLEHCAFRRVVGVVM